LFEYLAVEDDHENDMGKSVLGCLISSLPRRFKETGQLEIMIVQPVPSKKSSWALHFVHNLIHDFRKFAAVTEYADKVPFLQALLGNDLT
jgi:hypothetical protein